MTDLPRCRTDALMRTVLDKIDRDLIFYSANTVGQRWKWGNNDGPKGTSGLHGGHLHRTQRLAINRHRLQQNTQNPFAGPATGTTPTCSRRQDRPPPTVESRRPTGLTDNEHSTHIGFGPCSPPHLILGCDMNSMDEFTTNPQCNDEMSPQPGPLGKTSLAARRSGH